MKNLFKLQTLVVLAAIIFITATTFFNLIKNQKFEFNIEQINDYKQIKENLSNLNPDTLVVLDVDEVLITSPDILAKGVDFPWQLQVKILLRHPSLIFSKNWEMLYSKMWIKAPRRLIDKDIPQIISSLKQDNITTILLTNIESGSYGEISSFPKWRYKTLKKLKIDLDGQFENHCLKSLPKHRGDFPMLYKGIISTNHQGKGNVLQAFIKQNNLSPSKIIFIDDRVKNLKSVGHACKKMNIKCKLIQFKSKSSTEVDESIAFKQIDNLIKTDKWMSDKAFPKKKTLPSPHTST